MIDGCIENNIKELYLASSSEVYQTPNKVPTNEKEPLKVPDVYNPRYSYGAGKIISLSGRNFSFDPRTMELRSEGSSAQHGMSFDDYGRQFVCSNSSHIMALMYPSRYAGRNKH